MNTYVCARTMAIRKIKNERFTTFYVFVAVSVIVTTYAATKVSKTYTANVLSSLSNSKGLLCSIVILFKNPYLEHLYMSLAYVSPVTRLTMVCDYHAYTYATATGRGIDIKLLKCAVYAYIAMITWIYAALLYACVSIIVSASVLTGIRHVLYTSVYEGFVLITRTSVLLFVIEVTVYSLLCVDWTSIRLENVATVPMCILVCMVTSVILIRVPMAFLMRVIIFMVPGARVWWDRRVNRRAYDDLRDMAERFLCEVGERPLLWMYKNKNVNM